MSRIVKVQKLLEVHHLDAIIIDEPIDIFYLTGLFLSLGRLVISSKDATLFVDGRYFEKCKHHPLVSTELTKGYGKESMFSAHFHFRNKRVGFDSIVTSYAVFEEFQHLNATFVPLKSPVKRIRAIKEISEIEALKKAAQLGSRGFDYTVNLLKKGVTEEEIAKELELFWRKSGGQRLSFSPHIAFGQNSAFPHHHAGKSELSTGDIILIDIGIVHDFYHSDMTRVVFFENPPSELEKIYLIVKDAQAKALEKCKPSVLIKEVDAAARKWIADKGYEQFFPHSLGHGIGLEIHEFPVIRSQGEDSEKPLEEGMVITIEPGIYVPGIGGVRLEDTIVITKEGFENLTNRPLSISLPMLT